MDGGQFRRALRIPNKLLCVACCFDGKGCVHSRASAPDATIPHVAIRQRIGTPDAFLLHRYAICVTGSTRLLCCVRHPSLIGQSRWNEFPSLVFAREVVFRRSCERSDGSRSSGSSPIATFPVQGALGILRAFVCSQSSGPQVRSSKFSCAGKSGDSAGQRCRQTSRREGVPVRQRHDV